MKVSRIRDGIRPASLLLVSWVFLVAGLQAQATSRVSLDSNGNEGNQGSGESSISADGRFVAFSSFASNLVPGDTNNVEDVFRRDLTTGQTIRVSISSGGVQGNFASGFSAISDDGMVVAFVSDATNLVPNDLNSVRDVYVRDLGANTTELISVDSNGVQANRESLFPNLAISGDGRFVAFSSRANNLTFVDTQFNINVFLHDRLTGQTWLVSESPSGSPGSGDSLFPSLSSDGRFIAFSSSAPNLVFGDNNSASDVFVQDFATGQNFLMSKSLDGVLGDLDSLEPSISADGDLVAFSSLADNLVSGDTNGKKDVFLAQRSTGAIARVSVGSGKTQGDGDSTTPSISSDGHSVAFSSLSDNLVSDDFNARWDIFRFDVSTRRLKRISVGQNGLDGNDNSFRGSSSGDGRKVTFSSPSSNLVPNDGNRSGDVFLRDLDAPPNPDIDSILLSGDTQGSPGGMVNFQWSSAPADSPFWLFASRKLGGSVINGQLFDVGPRLKVVDVGLTDATGSASVVEGPIPASLSGKVFFLEVRVDSGGRTFDSNPLTLQIN